MATPLTVNDVKKDPRVKEIYKETEEGFGGSQSSWWMYLKRGFCWDDDGLHTIHEATLKKAIQCLKQVRVCRCEECEVRNNPRQTVIDLDSKATVAKVNTLLAACGRKEEVCQGNGYVYFWEGTAPEWTATSIAVNKLGQLTVRRCLECFEDLFTDFKNEHSYPRLYPPPKRYQLKLDGKPLLSTQWRTR